MDKDINNNDTTVQPGKTLESLGNEDIKRV